MRDFRQFSQVKTFEKDIFCRFPQRHSEATGNREPRDETRGGIKTSIFVARRPPILTLRGLKIDVFLRVFLGTFKFATSKSMFRARLPSIFSTSHKMPRLATESAPCRHLTQPCQCNLQKARNTTRLKVLRLPRKMTTDTSKVLRLPPNCNATSLKYCACHTKRLSTLQNTSECHEVHACTRNEATRRFEPPK